MNLLPRPLPAVRSFHIAALPVLTIAMLLVWLAARAAWGCASASKKDERVEIRDEQALIVWDAKSQTEHFIRQATFETGDKDFGFLVPTPTKPELGEVDSSVFGSLSYVTQPRVEFVTVRVAKRPDPRKFESDQAVSASKSSAEPAKVLDQVEVAGFDVAILEADNPDAIGDWLKAHDYAFRPELRDWLAGYTDKHWIISAFKLANNAPGSRQFHGQAVRMSFHTEVPFYPYREPEDSRRPATSAASQTTYSPSTYSGSRLLRLFFLSADKMAGELGQPGTAWKAATVWTNPVDSQRLLYVAKYLGAASLDEKTCWLSEFEDRQYPRPGTDEVFFEKSLDSRTVERPVHTITDVVSHWPPEPGEKVVEDLVEEPQAVWREMSRQWWRFALSGVVVCGGALFFVVRRRGGVRTA